MNINMKAISYHNKTQNPCIFVGNYKRQSDLHFPFYFNAAHPASLLELVEIPQPVSRKRHVSYPRIVLPLIFTVPKLF